MLVTARMPALIRMGFSMGMPEPKSACRHPRPGVSFVQFGDADVVRHPLVGHIVRAYDKHDAARQEAERQGGRSADGYRR